MDSDFSTVNFCPGFLGRRLYPVVLLHHPGHVPASPTCSRVICVASSPAITGAALPEQANSSPPSHTVQAPIRKTGFFFFFFFKFLLNVPPLYLHSLRQEEEKRATREFECISLWKPCLWRLLLETFPTIIRSQGGKLVTSEGGFCLQWPGAVRPRSGAQGEQQESSLVFWRFE